MSNITNFQRGEKRVKELVFELVKKYSLAKYQITFNSVYCKDVDIWVIDRLTGKPIVVIESTNYSWSSYMCYKDVKRYIQNLTKYSCKRVLVVSYIRNIKNDYHRFIKHKIQVKVIGYQT